MSQSAKRPATTDSGPASKRVKLSTPELESYDKSTLIEIIRESEDRAEYDRALFAMKQSIATTVADNYIVVRPHLPLSFKHRCWLDRTRIIRLIVKGIRQ